MTRYFYPAPVVQRIERPRPKGQMWVRLLLGVLLAHSGNSNCSKGKDRIRCGLFMAAFFAAGGKIEASP